MHILADTTPLWITPSEYVSVIMAYGASCLLVCCGVSIVIWAIKAKHH